ncbi:3163_t:CDS:1 [Acaulospora morrowiae]|uniref:3163_t:CDS:1 n=1 Tax=Acaulospora morrowiae TaxID=94023 RepID=A0A9N9F0G8_9GLOM|nr:3163_t:CDS:1 [Acaulospora morrowiae]
MVRGDSLAEDLKSLVNNSKYSDLEIRCEDGILYGNRAILAARSDVLEPLLYNNMSETHKREISFPKIKASVMKVILEYLYTELVPESNLSMDNALGVFQAADYLQLNGLKELVLCFYKHTCLLEGNAPELLSKVVQHISPLVDNEIINFLVESIAKIPLDAIEFDQLSFKAFQRLLSMTHDGKMMFVTNEYSVLRFAILLAAKETSQKAFDTFEVRLPTWDKIMDGLYVNNFESSDISDDISGPISQKLESLIEFIDLRRINGKIITNIIEPLNLITQENIMNAFRSHIREEIHSSFRGIQYLPKEIKWDENGCGSNLVITDGYTVSSTRKGYQSVRTNYLMSGGIHELCIKIEEFGGDIGIGVCSEGLNYMDWAGHQAHGWILISSGGTGHNEFSRRCPDIAQPFNCPGSEVTVHLNMDKKTCAFSINGKRYPPIPEWNDLPPRLYFVASLSSRGRLKIMS